MRLRSLWLALWVGAACSPSADEFSFPANVCATDADCKDGTTCSAVVKRCADEKARGPYTLVLQVAPTSHSELPARYTFKSQVLSKGNTAHALEIPHALRTNGLVSVGENMVLAEVSFQAVSEKDGYPAVTTVVTSNEGTLPAAGEAAGDEQPHNLTVRLPPMTTFSVNIQPLLGKLSAKLPPLPPVRTTFQTGSDAASDFRFSYDDKLETLQQTLVADDSAEPQAGRWLRLRHAENGRVLSSSTQTASDGSFELGVLTGSLDEDDYVLEVGLNPDDPWSEVIHVAAQRIDRAGREPITIPSVPERVLLTGSVEARADETALPGAELTFVSRFPVPKLTGELHQRDWCRAQPTADEDAPPLACSAEQTVSTQADGSFQVSLLPGDYDVYISPSPDSDPKRRAATTKASISIETRTLHGSQGPVVFQLEKAILFTGSLKAPDRTPLPSVVVRAQALSMKGWLGREAAYNRSTSTITDGKGKFAMSVDNGYADVVAEPPQESGYPLLYFPNHEFNVGRAAEEQANVTMHLPVLLAGKLSSRGKPLAEAEIDAFAIVKDLRGFKRAVLIANTTSDATGHYVLTLPTSIDDTTPDSEFQGSQDFGSR